MLPARQILACAILTAIAALGTASLFADDNALPPIVSGSTTSVPLGLPGQIFKTPDPDAARQMARSAVAGIVTVAGQVAQLQKDLNAAFKQRLDLENQKAALLNEQDETMKVIDQGLFCSQCGRSVLDLGGINAFYQHLAEVHGHPVTDTAKIKAEKDLKSQQFAQRLADLNNQLDQCRAQIAKDQNDIADGNDQLADGNVLWRAAVQYEKDAIWAREAEAEKQHLARMGELDRDLNKQQGLLDDAMKQSPPDPGLVKSLTSDVDAMKLQRDVELGAWRARPSVYQQLDAATASKEADYQEIFGALGPASGAPAFPTLPKASLGMKGEPLSVDMSPKGVSMCFDFGKLKSCVSAQETASNQMKVSAFFQLFSTKLGMSQVTTDGADGVSTQSLPLFETGLPIDHTTRPDPNATGTSTPNSTSTPNILTPIMQ